MVKRHTEREREREREQYKKLLQALAATREPGFSLRKNTPRRTLGPMLLPDLV
jgi:hypothetical protein